MRINKTAIIILNYRTYQDTINCVESVLKFAKAGSFNIFIVDNDSQNNSLAIIEKHFCESINIRLHNSHDRIDIHETKILLLQAQKNTGYAAGNNIGLKLAYSLGFSHLMVLNNDTLFVEDTISSLSTTLYLNKNILCVGPLLLKGDGKSIDYNCAKKRPNAMDIFRLSYIGQKLKTESWKNSYYYTYNNSVTDNIMEVDIISGSCMFFDAENFHKIGFFDDSTFLYYEEAIITEKAREKGFKIYLNTKSKVIHLGAQSTKTQSTSLFTVSCEYNSLKLYLNRYRQLGWLKSGLLLMNNAIFIQALILKNKLENAKLFI